MSLISDLNKLGCFALGSKDTWQEAIKKRTGLLLFDNNYQNQSDLFFYTCRYGAALG